MREPARWSTILAPMTLIGGWWAAAETADRYDPIRQTISELAALDMSTAQFMAGIFAATGIAHLVTAWFTPGLRPIARILLGLAGLAVLAVAALPLPSVTSDYLPHRIAGVTAFLLLAAWPFAAINNRTRGPFIGPLRLSWLATVNLTVTLWFFYEWSAQAAAAGFIERWAATAGVLMPTIIVHTLWWREREGRQGARRNGTTKLD